MTKKRSKDYRYKRKRDAVAKQETKKRKRDKAEQSETEIRQSRLNERK